MNNSTRHSCGIRAVEPAMHDGLSQAAPSPLPAAAHECEPNQIDKTREVGTNEAVILVSSQVDIATGHYVRSRNQW